MENGRFYSFRSVPDVIVRFVSLTPDSKIKGKHRDSILDLKAEAKAEWKLRRLTKNMANVDISALQR